MAGPIYPATTSGEAVALTISNANQFHQVVNGDTETTVETYQGLGNIPSVAKALKDAAAYKTPVAWVEGDTETELLQPRLFNSNIYVPLTVPAFMGGAPTNTAWRLYAPLSRVIVLDEFQTGSDISGGISTLQNITYAVGENNLQVYVDRARAYLGVDYLETNESQIEWLVDIDADAVIAFYAGSTTSGNIDANYLLSLVGAAEAAATSAENSATDAQESAEEAALAAASVTLLNVKSVSSPYTLLTGLGDNKSILVFDTSDPCEIILPAGITTGVSVSFRNKQGGEITLIPDGTTLVGAGNTTNDSTKANSLYVEDTNYFVSVGDMSEV
jgi:hypothetical protein